MVELFVSLKIPDTTAITARQALNRMGFKLEKLKRYDYYFFEGGELDELSKVDILVNANKHKAEPSIMVEDDEVIAIVKDIPNQGEGILNTLKNRLGIEGVKKVVKGVAWVLPKENAEKIVNTLLFNENYQEVEWK